MTRNEIQITTENGRTTITTPYNRDFVTEIKTIGGRWNPADKTWAVDARDEARARAIVTEIYGHDGTPEATGDLVTVRADLSQHERERAFLVGGVPVVKRQYRDADPILSDGVIIVSGSFPGRGGSQANPRLGENNVIIEVRDIPRKVAEAEGLEIVDEKLSKRAALEAEKAALLARLAEIEAELAN